MSQPSHKDWGTHVVNKGLFSWGGRVWLSEQEDRWVLGGKPMNARDSAVTYGAYLTPPPPKRDSCLGQGDGAGPEDECWGQQQGSREGSLG